jgi:excisionase family DNA binding protein
MSVCGRILPSAHSMQPQPTSEKITTSTVARRLEVSEGTVRAMERRGVLVATRAGRIRLFDYNQVEALAHQMAARREQRRGTE